MQSRGNWTMKVRGCAVVLLVGIMLGGSARAEDATALAARLHATADATSIDVAGMEPWHLKLAVQLFDPIGKATEKGTIEEWWASPEARRVTFTFPSFSGTQLHSKDGAFATKDGAFEPGVLDDVLAQVVHPMARNEEIDHSTPELQKQKFGKVALECVLLAQPLKNVFLPIGLFPTYCLDPGTNALRVVTEAGALMFSLNRTQSFQGRSVATDLAGRSPDVVRATAQVTTLESWTPGASDFLAATEMIPITENTVELSEQAAGLRPLTTVAPVVPRGSMGTSGTMIFHIVLGRDGRIHSLHVVSTPDASVAINYAEAMRHWTFKPFSLNGAPAEVDTLIRIKYEFN